MKTDIIHISEKTHFGNAVRSVISFKKFVEFLKVSVQSGKSLKTPYFKWILKKFKRLPELSGTVGLDKVKDYEEMLEMVSTCLMPLASDEKTLWALGNALAPEIFYGTDGFFELMNYLKHPAVLDPTVGTPDAESEKIMLEIQYGLVFEKIYKLPYLKKTQWVRKFEDPETGLDKYFLVSLDSRFVEIKPVDELPALDCTAMSPSSVWGEEFKKIQKLIPLNRFEARGFSVISLSDITSQQAIEQIGKLIINHTEADMAYLFGEITHSLQTIAGSRFYQFGIMPFLTVNDRPALIYENFPFSIIMQTCFQASVSKKDFNSLRNEFSRNPHTVIWSADNKENIIPDLISDAFRNAGISTYMMFPVFHNDKLTGIFEISTKGNYPMMSEEQLLNLKPALPLITQLIQNLIAHFNSSIESIIKEKFTSIQPSVQWKFNETAWHYLRDHEMEEKTDPVESISFRGLYPLYGAVDIRNSTIFRNEALEKDFYLQLHSLTAMLTQLIIAGYNQVESLLNTASNWLQIIPGLLTTQQQIRLGEFFNLDVTFELENIIQVSPESKKIIEPYLLAIEEETGIAFENRRRLEAAIQQLNKALNDYYEMASAELQLIYPCYFEKFRTDGVEYDIYVGQSIAPKKPFLKEYLQMIKRWQLESMINIVQVTEEMKSSMAFLLQTTQLLFVHPQTIDITFRKDERRFDVEGAYNIRYHIIKKRIDKVVILDSDERLTQPGKIALVYFDDRDAKEYKDYIKELQVQNLLLDDLEELDLEALQGVNGLKALRVGVRL